MNNTDIFKSYDVRGIYPREFNNEAAFDIARALVKHYNAKKVVIGQDARISSPDIFKAVVRGIKAEGSEIYDIGQVPTECLYFAVGNYDFDTGIMITASHNPKEYNGLKIIKKIGRDIQIIRGKDLVKFIEPGDFKNSPFAEAEKKDIWKDYSAHILSFIDLSEITPFKVVIDASNGVAGHLISKIQDKLPVEIIMLNSDPNGNFPNHSPNPLADGSADQIKKKIKSEKADFGLIIEGDAYRIFLVDEGGELVRADVTLLLLAKYFLQKNPKMAVAYNAICSKAVPEFIKRWDGKPVRTKVGFVNVRDGLLENNGIIGGELSGHYCFKDNFYLDSGMIAMLVLLQVISKDGRKITEIISELSPYAKSSELNFKVKDKEKILERIKEEYSDGKQDFLDGVTVEYEDWWFNVRPSNTEPLLRLTIEANAGKILKEKQKELTKIIA